MRLCRAEKPTAPALPVIKGVIFLCHKREDWQRGLLKTAMIGCSLCAQSGGEVGGQLVGTVMATAAFTGRRYFLPARLTRRVAVGIDVAYTARHRSAVP